jgi:hypothetical protein
MYSLKYSINLAKAKKRSVGAKLPNLGCSLTWSNVYDRPFHGERFPFLLFGRYELLYEVNAE